MKMIKLITVTAAMAALGLAGCKSTGGSADEAAAAPEAGVPFRTVDFPELAVKAEPKPDGVQAPYLDAPAEIPGVIQAEAYDWGGEGVAFHEETTDPKGKKGSKKCSRNDNVYSTFRKIKGFKGCVVGWTFAGEWLEYTVDVKETATYDMTFSFVHGFESSNRGKFKLQVEQADGSFKDVTSEISVPFTDFVFADWHSLTVADIQLEAGVQVMRVAFTDNGGAKFPGNIDYFKFEKK